MIGTGINAIRFQNLSQFFHFLTAQTIDDTGLTGITLDELNDILVYIIRLTAYLIIKIRTIDASAALPSRKLFASSVQPDVLSFG